MSVSGYNRLCLREYIACSNSVHDVRLGFELPRYHQGFRMGVWDSRRLVLESISSVSGVSKTKRDIM